MNGDFNTPYEAGMAREWRGRDEAENIAIKALCEFDGWLAEGLTVADVKTIVHDIAWHISWGVERSSTRRAKDSGAA